MSAIEVFGRPVPRRAIIGFVGADPDAISRALHAAIDSGNRADLIVDYALDLLDPLARMRSRRDLIAARHTGATILLASYREDLLRELCDEIWWIGVDAIEMRGDPGEVLDRWKKATVELWRQEQNGAAPRMVPGLDGGRWAGAYPGRRSAGCERGGGGRMDERRGGGRARGRGIHAAGGGSGDRHSDPRRALG